MFVQNIHCEYMLEPPQGGSNVYPQCMFRIKTKKNMYTPANPSFSVYKWGLRGYTFHGHVSTEMNGCRKSFMTNCIRYDNQSKVRILGNGKATK